MPKNRFFRSIGVFPGLSVSTPFDFKDKENNIADYVFYMLSRTQSMFEYTGLPESIPARMLELYLQCNGNVCIAEHNGTLYAFTGGLGGEPDVYYRPTIYTVSNPALNWSKNLKIGEDCIVFPSDSMFMGLLPMFRRYATQMAENDLTIRIADINSRIQSLISAPDDRTKTAADKYLQGVEKGDLATIAETAFLDGIRTQPYASPGNSNNITQLIELQQYLKAGWYNDIGLQSNYNMKRESINSNEAQLNEESLLPLVDDMLRCRQKGLEDVNKRFGTNISVKLFSSWEDRAKMLDAQDVLSGQSEETPEEPETGGEENEPPTDN